MMSSWKSKKLKKKGKASQTPGRTKGENCKADWRKKYYMCHPHACRKSDYGPWHQKAFALNKQVQSAQRKS